MRLNTLLPPESAAPGSAAIASVGDDRQLRIIEAGTVDYEQAWAWQQRLSAARLDGTGGDTVLLLQHPPVYTAGKRTRPADRPTDGSPVIDVDRGGRITWHGPGQLVGYPIVALAQPIDVVAYVRILEEVLIATCEALGLTTGRVDGRSGVWVASDPQTGRPERKIAAIGVRIARGITQHGFALNCNPDLTAYDRIVPCGIEDAGVTSLTAELGRQVTVEEMTPILTPVLRAALDGELPVQEHHLPTPTPASGVQWDLHPALG
ncbi:MAG: lipoyl(octanoyl) transferase LipB [Nakamurella sp.]